MCKCTPEIRTPFCGRGDCLPPGYANLGEWLGEQEAAAQMSLDRVWEQAVQQAMEGHKADPAQAALNWAHNYATKHEPRGSDSDADIAHLIVEQTKRIAELTIENGQLYIQLDRDEWPGLRQQLRQAEERALATIATLTTRAEQAEARIGDAVRVITQLQQRAQLAEARVAELTAALEEYEDKATIYVELDKTSVMARVVTSTALKQLEEGFANAIAKGRAAMEGQR